MQLQREWFDGQLKMQMQLDQKAREKYLTECSPKNAKLKRWCLALQEFDIIINYTKGSANTVADGLSHIS